MRAILSVLLVLGVTSAARAENLVAESDMVRCAGILSDSKRLECYDTLAMTVSAEAARIAEGRKLAATERAASEVAEKARLAQQSFGAEDVKDSRDEERGAKLDRVESTIKEVSKDLRGRYVLLLENGQSWRQLDGVLYGLKSGDAISVKRRVLSGYFLTVERVKRTVSAERIR